LLAAPKAAVLLLLTRSHTSPIPPRVNFQPTAVVELWRSSTIMFRRTETKSTTQHTARRRLGNPFRRLFTIREGSIPALLVGKTEESGAARQEDTVVPEAERNPYGEPVLDAVIVGAGWAGLGAGNLFLKNTERLGRSFEFTILEGHSDIGGRSRTLAPISEEFPDSMLELGSQWIHGVHRRNQVYQLARKHDIILHYDKGDDDWNGGKTSCWIDKRDDAGKLFVERIGDDVARELEKKLLVKGFIPFLRKYPAMQKKESKKRLGSKDNNNEETPSLSISMNDVYEEYCKLKQLPPDDARFLRWMLDINFTQDYAASIEDIDAVWWDHDKEFTGGELHFGLQPENADRGNVRGGYSALIKKYAAPLLEANLIKCNCVVTSIDYNHSPAIVEYMQIDPNASSEAQSTLHRIFARSVLCTVPLGVLKANTIQFIPPLPPRKCEAIEKLGMGLLNKVVLLWNHDERALLPWLFPLDQTRPPRKQRMTKAKSKGKLKELKEAQELDKEMGKQTHRLWMERIDPPGVPQGPWTACYNPHTHHLGSPTSPILLYFFLGGRTAAQVESMSDEEIQSQAVASLREWFDSPEIPDPQRVILTRWGQDKLSMGSYSYYQVGSGPRERKELKVPELNRLFIAGEATHVEYYATTHGALMSGVEAAKQIWKRQGTPGLRKPGKVRRPRSSGAAPSRTS
jgi:monoamine oxidase